MKKIGEKAKIVGTIICDAFAQELTNEGTVGLSAAIGLYQGLKYGGNLKRGITGGMAVYVTFSAIRAVRNIMDNKDYIRNL